MFIRAALLFLLLAVLAPTVGAAEQAVVVDNSASSVSSKGQWAHAATTPGFHGDDYQFRVAGSGENHFFWPFNAPEGDYEVHVRWTSGPNRASDATYIVRHQAGESTAVVNQQVDGGRWRRIGVFRFRPEAGHGVILTDRANGVVVADAVLFAPPGGAVGQPTPAAAPAPDLSQESHPAPAVPAPAGPAPVIASSLPQPPAVVPPPSRDDPRYFPQTRYAIEDDRFWDYFHKRGGVRTFGYPVSNTFTLMGYRVQVFQRQIMQLGANGGVALLNLLDGGLMPYTRVNSSTFPGHDPEVVRLHPGVDQPDYHLKALEFVREFAPDTWQGLPVNFYQTLANTVRYEDAFPGGDGDPNLVQGFNLEIWGLPTSRPTFDPSNQGFVYLRFQRGIMHYDDACKCTQSLLLADYLKGILLGRGLPPDLEAQAKSSPLFAQYNSQRPQALNRPQELFGSDLTNGFRRDPIITIDPGHGGKEIGSSFQFTDGTHLLEKDLNLQVSRKVAAALRQLGYEVVETRTADTWVNHPERDLTGDGQITMSDDLQARIDIANNANSDLLLSIHFNGASNPDRRGTYMFYNPQRPFSDRSKAFAEMAQKHLVQRLREAGYETIDHGVRTDQSALGGDFHFYLLGPQSDIITRESRMPAALGEALFLTNPDDANALSQEHILNAITQGYVDAVREYFTRFEAN